MKLNGWGYLIWLIGLLLSAFGCTAGTPPPPAVTITPVVDSGSVRVVTWTNRDNDLLISFYMIGANGNVIPATGTAHLQISKPRKNGCVKFPPVPEQDPLSEEIIVDSQRCLLFSISEPVQPSDFELEFKQYVHVRDDPREWSSGWHYWYTFVVPYDAALEELGNTVDIRVWFVHSHGDANNVWRWQTEVIDGRLVELEPFERLAE